MSKTILSLIAVLFICPLMSFERNPKQETPKERTYTVVIPEHLINPFYSILNGGSVDNLTVGQMKELTATVNNQVQSQYQKYHIEDSIALSKKISSRYSY
jgi:hypothetical protein